MLKVPNRKKGGGSATKPLTIGKVARMAGVGIETIRFYEREDWLPIRAKKA